MVAVGVIALLLAFLLVGALASRRVAPSAYTVSLPGLAVPVRILGITDTHGTGLRAAEYTFTVDAGHIAPDLICVAGDLLSRRHDFTRAAADLLGSLRQIAPVFVSRGNHDLDPRQWQALKEATRRHDPDTHPIHFLEDSARTLSVAGSTITVAGLNDLVAFKEDRIAFLAALRELAASVSHLPRPHILLSHRPEFIPDYARAGFDLSLSGHAHGGQVRIPGLGALWAPEQGFFPRYAESIHAVGSLTAVVSRGLGPSRFPFRVFNPPELVLLTCLPQSEYVNSPR